MSFIERERDRINEFIRNTPSDHEAYQVLHAAQQALSWAMDPDAYMSPTGSIHKFFGIGQEGTKGTGVIWPADGMPTCVLPESRGLNS